MGNNNIIVVQAAICGDLLIGWVFLQNNQLSLAREKYHHTSLPPHNQPVSNPNPISYPNIHE